MEFPFIERSDAAVSRAKGEVRELARAHPIPESFA